MRSLGTLQSKETQNKVVDIIEKTFDARPMPRGYVTQSEVNRRVGIAKEVFLTLLNECYWSEQRILDHLPSFTVRAIDGKEAIPEWAKKKIGDEESVMWGKDAAGHVERDSRLSALARKEPLIVIPGRSHNGD